MPCYICKGKSQFYQRLDRSRARFMRKVYPDFSDASYLCMKCFEKFEKIFRSKKKSKNGTSEISITSNASLRTVSSKSTSSKENQTTKDVSSKENTQSNGSPPLVFLSHSYQVTSNDSNDSTDNLVHRTSEIPSLKDSARVARNADIAVAREGAVPAERSALRRKRTREEDIPQITPITTRRLDIVDEESSEEEEVASILEPTDLAHVRPIPKKRKQPVVHFNQNIMDIYLANTSGG